MTMWDGRIIAAALPTKAATAQLAFRRLRTTRQYIASRTATAAKPYRVISKIRPTAHELKSFPGMNGTGARNRQARNPNRKAPRETDLVTCLTSVPVSAAAASSRSGKTIRCRASSGGVPKIVMAMAPSHASPQWYQVCDGSPAISVKPDGE